jgi:acetyl esterase/lipase
MREQSRKRKRQAVRLGALSAWTALVVISGLAFGAEPRLGVVYGDSEATLDFFPALPTAKAPKRAPLLAFVTGRFWGIEGTSSFSLAELVAAPLRAEGISVALIRHRPAPDHTHPAFAEDAASAIAWLVAHAKELGVDPARIFLAGHASGAQVAALVALDPSYLAAEDLDAEVLAGVIPISGIYDLEREQAGLEELSNYYRLAFPTSSLQREASPVRQVRADAPSFLVLAAQHDIPGFVEAAAGFSGSLRRAGHPEAETFLAVGKDHQSVLNMNSKSNPARRHLMGFIGVGEGARAFRDTLAARSYWRKPNTSTEPFWAYTEQIKHHPEEPRLTAAVRAFFKSGGGRGVPIAVPRYDAIDLFALLDAMGSERVGSGRWLVLTNLRHERAVLDLELLRPYEPRVVIGLDGERNLFRVVDLYQTQRRYSWRESKPDPWILTRSAGAFIYFALPPPASVITNTSGLFGLTPESFQLTDSDPLAPLSDLEEVDRNLLVRDKACVSCHQFRGVGARAGHIRASDGELVGGFALPLEEYPPEVWRRYCFEQKEVATELGVRAVGLSPEWQQRLFDLVVRERDGATDR